jgi:quercetin 2,3-dioxygenase
MLFIRKSNERGNSQIGWLNSYHTFSFADYYDPEFMGFGNLRVINEDTVQPSYGFGRHPHDNMEIISYVVAGSLEHKDSMGTGSIIKPGEIQIMSAGTGVEHSEFNHSKTELLHFLQIWIIPEKQNLKPSYQQKTIPKEHNKLILIGSGNKQNADVVIHQRVDLYAGYLSQGHAVTHDLMKGNNAWIQLVKGTVEINDNRMTAGDGVAITDENKIEIKCIENAELLLFDLQ